MSAGKYYDEYEFDEFENNYQYETAYGEQEIDVAERALIELGVGTLNVMFLKLSFKNQTNIMRNKCYSIVRTTH